MLSPSISLGEAFIYLFTLQEQEVEEAKQKITSKKCVKTKAKQEDCLSRGIQIKCVSRSIDFRENCSSVQLLIHQILILYYSRRNKNMTMCEDEVHIRGEMKSVIGQRRSDDRRGTPVGGIQFSKTKDLIVAKEVRVNTFICRRTEGPTINP